MTAQLLSSPILATIPTHARYLHFRLRADVDSKELRLSLARLQEFCQSASHVWGLSFNLAEKLGLTIAGLREFKQIAGSQINIPGLSSELWLWLRGDDPGVLFHQQRKLVHKLAREFELSHVTVAFRHREGRDLSGYVDGTENPQGEDALATALRSDGSSLVAIQRWRHRFDDLARYSEAEQDQMIGRRQSDDVELEDAPASAHVKRTAQEDFQPAAFVLRRSMPWAEQTEAGLYFTAFATDLSAFEAQLRRMSGAEDGIVDSLFKFSQPEFTAYYWCPDRADTSWLAPD